MKTGQKITQIGNQVLFVVVHRDTIDSWAAFAALFELPLGYHAGAAAPNKPPLAAWCFVHFQFAKREEQVFLSNHGEQIIELFVAMRFGSTGDAIQTVMRRGSSAE